MGKASLGCLGIEEFPRCFDGQVLSDQVLLRSVSQHVHSPQPCIPLRKKLGVNTIGHGDSYSALLKPML